MIGASNSCSEASHLSDSLQLFLEECSLHPYSARITILSLCYRFFSCMHFNPLFRNISLCKWRCQLVYSPSVWLKRRTNQRSTSDAFLYESVVTFWHGLKIFSHYIWQWNPVDSQYCGQYIFKPRDPFVPFSFVLQFSRRCFATDWASIFCFLFLDGVPLRYHY